ncbi:MAG: hypothetical protein CM15mP103_00060 [Gammaproteobacteria bacterium]|nr:MAG: hypothetical protein CM15mP103_00060 [Gammaproteobacteria bacterium]
MSESRQVDTGTTKAVSTLCAVWHVTRRPMSYWSCMGPVWRARSLGQTSVDVHELIGLRGLEPRFVLIELEEAADS